MDGKAGSTQAKLKHIVAVLLALADVADRVAVRPGPFQWLVLWNLWMADAVVRDFVGGSGHGLISRQAPPALSALRCGHEPADALALAVSLRTLASCVRDMAIRLYRLSFLQPLEVSRIGRRLRAFQPAPVAAFLPVEADDTS